MAEVHRGDWNDGRLVMDFGVVETNAWPVLVVWLGSRHHRNTPLRYFSFLVSRVLPNGNNRIFYLGQFMGTILLTLFFIFIMTPMGLVLRLTGNDLLKLKMDPTSSSYWQEPRKTGGHRKMF